MRAVAVDVDVVQPLGIDVAADVAPALDDETLPAALRRLMGEHRAEQAGPDDQIIIHKLCLTCDLLSARK